jgi:hypothetical protein
MHSNEMKQKNKAMNVNDEWWTAVTQRNAILESKSGGLGFFFVMCGLLARVCF